MNSRVQKIIYKGKSILYFDYRGLNKNSEAEFIKTIEDAAAFMVKQGPNQLVISDLRDTFGTSDVVNKFKEVAKITRQVRKKGAVIGITGIKAVLLKAVNMFSNSNLLPFDTPEQAKEWLVKD